MGLPLVSVAEGLDRQPRLKVQYLRRRALGLNYEVHVSGDLESFGPMGGDESIEPINEVWERVTLLESEPSSISSSRFARVQVTAD